MAAASTATSRPILRGYIHLAAALVAPGAFVALLLIADSPRAYVGATIFATSVLLLYTTSASYHLVGARSRLAGIAKRLDHSMIFVLIAGSYTPFCLQVLGTAWGITMLAIVWSVAGLGVVVKVLWPSSPKWLGVALYLAVGWLAVVAAFEIVSWFSAGPLALLILGGALYSIGAIVYATERPNPYPRVFGFHEIFHVLVVSGTAVHYALIAGYVLPS